MDLVEKPSYNIINTYIAHVSIPFGPSLPPTHTFALLASTNGSNNRDDPKKRSSSRPLLPLLNNDLYGRTSFPSSCLINDDCCRVVHSPHHERNFRLSMFTVGSSSDDECDDEWCQPVPQGSELGAVRLKSTLFGIENGNIILASALKHEFDPWMRQGSNIALLEEMYRQQMLQ